MSFVKDYVRVNWQDEPSTATPLSAANLNKMDSAIDKIETSLVKAQNPVGDAWSASVTYGVGAFVIYNDSLWKCLVQNSGQTPTEGTYWTKTSVAGELQSHDMYAYVANNAGAHNGIYRGKYLGSSVTAEQYANIANGTFKDLFIGDYWTIGGVNYRIAAFDYYLRCGNSDLTTHHAVIVPDTALYDHVMNDSNVTTGGYVGSKMYTEGLESAKTTIKTAFSGHVLNHRIYLTNAVANGRPSAAAWCDSEVDLMNEQMVYGSGIFSPVSDGTNVPANSRVEKSQLPLFQFRAELISNRTTYWLRDIVTAANFASIHGHGRTDSGGASNPFGVRPSFCIY